MSEFAKVTIFSHELKHLKNRAKKLKKAIGCKHSDALDQVAQSRGYKNWHEVNQEILARGETSGQQDVDDEDNDLTEEDEAFLRGEVSFKASPYQRPRQ